MKSAPRSQRWALSFADLALLLLGFFVMLQARPDPSHLAAGMRAAFGDRPDAVLKQTANLWFESGEAVLTPQAQTIIQDFAHKAGPGSVIVSSRGTEPAAARFDGWELAAARTAAVARALTQAGLPQDKVAIAIDPATGGGQVIQINRN